jgi:hypothetical protein
MPTGVIYDTRNLEAKGFGFIKPDTGETCEGGHNLRMDDYGFCLIIAHHMRAVFYKQIPTPWA